jgi:hypothetical protein
MRLIIPLTPTNWEHIYFQVGFFNSKPATGGWMPPIPWERGQFVSQKRSRFFWPQNGPRYRSCRLSGQKSLGPLEKSRFCARDHLESLKWPHLLIFKGWFHNVPPNLQHRDINSYCVHVLSFSGCPYLCSSFRGWTRGRTWGWTRGWTWGWTSFCPLLTDDDGRLHVDPVIHLHLHNWQTDPLIKI